MNLGVAAAVAASGLTSPFLLEIYRAWRDRHKRDIEVEQASLNLFYPTWKEEMARLHDELTELRHLVLALSEEVSRLGGDPKTIIYAPKEKPNE